MPRRRDLTLCQRNTEQVDVSVTLAGSPYDLTGAVVECYLKPSAATDDDDAAVTVLSTATSGVTVVDADSGRVRVTVPSAALVVAGVRWWRVDVVMSGARRTAVFGPLHVTDV